MAKKKTTKAAGDEEEAKSSKMKSIGIAVALVAVGAVVGPKLMGGGATPAAADGEPTTTTTEAGPVVVLDAITLNLADGHLLQIGLALELSPEAAEGGGGHGEPADEDDPTKGYARAIDATIGALGEETMASLSAPGGRDVAKEALTHTLEELYHGEIVGVYFHQFVMQ